MCDQQLASLFTPFIFRFARPLLCCLLLNFSAAAPAQIEQFSTAQCAQLEAALEKNREQQRRGYKLKQELKIKAQQAQLELQLQYHCQQPQAMQQPQRRHASSTGKKTRAQQAASVPSRQSKPLISRAKNQDKSQSAATLTMSVITVKAPFQGAKQLAWLNYYQPPFYCFGVRHTERIRQCVEQRQQAQQQFEQQYSERQPSQTNNLSDQ